MFPEPTRVAAAFLAYGSSITLETVGRRVYLRGNTYPVKEELRGMGAKWDRDERAWWISTTKYRKYKDEIDALVAGGSTPRATRKQVAYLLRLYGELGRRVDQRSLEKMPMADVSSLIDDLKKELSGRPKKPTGGGASPKQIDYALRLIRRLGRWGWHDSDYGQAGNPPPTRSELESWSSKEVSELIDSLRSEF